MHAHLCSNGIRFLDLEFKNIPVSLRPLTACNANPAGLIESLEQGFYSSLPWPDFYSAKLNVHTFLPNRLAWELESSNIQPMANIKTYLLVPHHDFRADGPVVLGSIITDLFDPEDSLNKESIVEIPSRYTSHKQDWEHTIELIRDGRTGVWARYLSFLGIGGNFGASFDTRTADHYRIKDLETTYFCPTQAYVEEAVNKPEVRSYLKGSRYAPVYMITGVKIARGPGSEIISKRSLGREGHAQFRLSVAGSPLALDVGDMMLHQAGADNTSFRGSSDFVIGFRLVKITFHENADGVRIPKQQKHTDGAMLGAKEGQTKVESYSTITVKVRFDGDEAIAGELREEDLITAIDEDDDQECRCFVLPLAET